MYGQEPSSIPRALSPISVNTARWKTDRQIPGASKPASLASQGNSRTRSDPISKPKMDISVGMTFEVAFQPQHASHTCTGTQKHTCMETKVSTKFKYILLSILFVYFKFYSYGCREVYIGN